MRIGAVQAGKPVIQAAKEPTAGRTAEAVKETPVKQYDTTSLSDTPPSDAELERLTRCALQVLKDTYRNVSIFTGNLNGREAIEQCARAVDGKRVLVISSDFLEEMSSSEEAYLKGKAILEEVLKQLSQNEQQARSIGAYLDEENATFWSTHEPPPPQTQAAQKSLIEQMREAELALENNRKKFQVKVSSSVYNIPSEVYQRLARANSVMDVKATVANANRGVFTLRAALGSCDKSEQNKIRAAIAALEKALNRAYGKIKDLNLEDDLRLQQRKAQKLRQKRKAEQVKAELAQKTAARRSRERAQITEGQPWFYYMEGVFGKYRLEDREEILEPYFPEFIPSDPVLGSAGVDASFTPPEVIVSEPVQISVSVSE